jgi:hypothetical protein
VDHDLIAAGHPQMKFEMLGYHALMPHHWNSDRDHVPEFETRLWAAGQTASVKAALTLLASRADRAQAWPEFSEYDCFACHHDLQQSSWRRDRGFAQAGNRVVLPWGVWHFAVLPELAKRHQDPTGQAFFQAYQKLEATMQGGFSPNPNLVKTQAAEALSALDAWMDHQHQPRFDTQIRQYLHARGTNEKPPRTWDEAVQLYLAAYAVLESAKSPMEAGQPQPLDAKLEELATSLGFPANYQSPRNFPAATATKADRRRLLIEVLKNLPAP